MLLLCPLGSIIFLAEFLVPQEFRVHSFGGNKLGTLLLFDTIGVCLGCVVVLTGVLLLLFLFSRKKRKAIGDVGE